MPPNEFITCGVDALSHGYNIVIFPEGTRTVAGRPVHLHRGFAYLQMASSADILPIKIKNNPPVLGKMQKWWDVGATISKYNITPGAIIRHKRNKNTNSRGVALGITDAAKNALF